MKQVNIVGLGTSWIDAPKDGECWGMTGLVHYRPVTRLFDIHDLEWNKEQWLNHYRLWLSHAVDETFMVNKAVLRWHSVQDELEKVKKLNVPLYSVKKYPDIPSSVAYPIEEVIAHFDSNYFSSTFDYAIALAIVRGI